MGPAERDLVVRGLKAELSRVLSDPATRADWAHSHSTSVLKLSRMPLEPGPAGGDKFGGRLAHAIGKGLKP